MNTITQSHYEHISIRQPNVVFHRLLTWIEEQEETRIAWVGISILVMTAVFFPITMASILFNGAPFGLIVGAMISLIVVLIPNLAALPVKFTLPALGLGIIIDVSMVIISFFY